MKEIAVDVCDITVTIGRKTILSGLNLQVEEGVFHGIVGPNGAGKTTMFNALQGFRRPVSGRISVLGQSPYPRNLYLLERIGIQPQRSAFFPRTSLREHLFAVADIRGTPRSRADYLIEALDLPRVADTKVEGLSGGERQRLAVATAIVHRPALLFLDEPTAGLDVEARKALVALLRSKDVLGMTTLYTTHYLDEAERLCDMVSIVDKGRIIATDSPSRLIADAQLGTTVVLPNVLHQADLVATILGSDSVRVVRDGLSIRTNDTAELFGRLAERGIDTNHAQVHDGRLEDVFLQLTGKGIDK